MKNLFACMSLVMALMAANEVTAQQFRIDTTIYAGDEEKQVSHNLTLFTDTVIYDFRMSNETPPRPAEIAVYDKRKSEFTIIDVARGIRTKIDSAELIKMVEGLRQQIKIDDRTRFLDEPLSESLSASEKEMTLSHSQIEYRFKGVRPKNQELLPVYNEYLIQFTRLMASDPRSLPPFARMRLNASIRKMGWIPTEIKAHYRANDLLKSEIKMISRHDLLEILSEKDHERIQSAKNWLMKCDPVSLPIYRGLAPAQATR